MEVANFDAQRSEFCTICFVYSFQVFPDAVDHYAVDIVKLVLGLGTLISQSIYEQLPAIIALFYRITVSKWISTLPSIFITPSISIQSVLSRLMMSAEHYGSKMI